MTFAETEACRVKVQSVIDGSKTIESRRLLGQFATPPELAREIARATVPFQDSGPNPAMLEPSAGTGSFISAFLGNRDCHISRVEAIEFDSAFFEAGRKIWSGFPVEYRNGDFTKLAPVGLFDLVVANPPYVRHHGLAADDKKRLQATVLSETGIRVSGLAGLYCHFLLLSLKWMRPGALGVWLIPTEWMSVNYGEALRSFFTEKVKLLRVHRFDAADVRFSDALVSSCVVWFKSEPPGEHAAFTRGESVEHPKETESIPLAHLRSAEKWPPSSVGQPQAQKPRLRDYFSIRRGIATGDNSFFVLPEENIAERGLPRAYLKPILPSPRLLGTDRVLADDQGIPSNAKRLFLFDCTGQDPAAFPRSVKDYLASGEKTTALKKLCAARTHWFDQEQRLPAPILCSYMGRGDGMGAPVRFILNESEAIAANSYLMLYPKWNLRRRFRDHPEDVETVWRLLREIPPDEFRRAGRCYGGGLQKMEPRELGDLDCTALQNWLAEREDVGILEEESGQLLLTMEPGVEYDAGKRRGPAASRKPARSPHRA